MKMLNYITDKLKSQTLEEGVLPRVGTGQLTNEAGSGVEAERDSGTESDAENAEIMALVEAMEDKKSSVLRRHASSSEVDSSHRTRYSQFSPVHQCTSIIREQGHLMDASHASSHTTTGQLTAASSTSTLQRQHRNKQRRRRRTDHYADHMGQPHHQHHATSGSQRSSLPAEFSFASSLTSDHHQHQHFHRANVSQTRGQSSSLMSSDSDECDLPKHHSHFRLNGRKRSLYDQTMPPAMLSSTGSDVGVANDFGGVANHPACMPASSSVAQPPPSSSSDDEVRQLLFPVLVVREPLSFHSKPPVGMRQRAPEVPACLFLTDRLCIRCESLDKCECNQRGHSAYKRIRCNSRLRPSLDLEKMQGIFAS